MNCLDFDVLGNSPMQIERLIYLKMLFVSIAGDSSSVMGEKGLLQALQTLGLPYHKEFITDIYKSSGDFVVSKSKIMNIEQFVQIISQIECQHRNNDTNRILSVLRQMDLLTSGDRISKESLRFLLNSNFLPSSLSFGDFETFLSRIEEFQGYDNTYDIHHILRALSP